VVPIVHVLLGFVVGLFHSRITLQFEIVALRHQLALYRRAIRRPPIGPCDRMLWAWFARIEAAGGRRWSSSSPPPCWPGSAAGFGSTGRG
jgi:hypothetical protein